MPTTQELLAKAKAQLAAIQQTKDAMVKAGVTDFGDAPKQLAEGQKKLEPFVKTPTAVNTPTALGELPPTPSLPDTDSSIERMTNLNVAMNTAVDQARQQRQSSTLDLLGGIVPTGALPATSFASVLSAFNRSSSPVASEFAQGAIGFAQQQEQQKFDLALAERDKTIAQQTDIRNLALSAIEAKADTSTINTILSYAESGDMDAAIRAFSSDLKIKKPEMVVENSSGRMVMYDPADPEGTFKVLLGSATGGGGGDTPPAPIGGEFANIIDIASTLGGRSAANVENVRRGLENALASGDYATTYSLIGNSVEESLTGGDKQRFANARTDFQIMSNLEIAIQKYADGGGDMGLLVGKEEEIKRKLGIDSGKATELAVQLWREFQTYRNVMTGAAFTPAESRDYAAVNPTLGKSLNLNLSVISGAKNALENRITSTIDVRVPGAGALYESIAGTSPTNEVTDDQIDKEYQAYLNMVNLEI